MYSVVMATMLAAGTTTPSWHHNRCYSSCYSCYSSSCYYSSCYCSSCYCSSCYCSSYRYCHGCYSCYSCYSCHSCYCSSCSVVYHHHGCSVCCGGVVISQPVVIEVPAKKKGE